LVEKAYWDPGAIMNSEKVLALTKRRGFLWPSSEIYGGIAGFYDYGPLGTNMKHNIEDLFRRYYVLDEGFAEISTSNISPSEVFVASGHVEEFTDFLVECEKCHEMYRADHLVLEYDEQADALTGNELAELLKTHDVKCQNCKGELSDPKPVNLMFLLAIGPGRGRPGYLRPETAQGIFTNFSLLYRYFREKLPFGVIQIGKGYRNEISPRQGIIRLREFNMAEAELFINPEDRSWHRFDELKDEELYLAASEAGEMKITLGDAVSKGIITSEVIGYFVALTKRFLVDAGVDPEKLRFRQHLKDEMAHYAADCWDAEAQTSLGWIELVGIADRTCYDLEGHIEHSKQDLRVFERYEEPKEIEKKAVVAKLDVLGPKFKGDAAKIKDALEALDPEMVEGKDQIEIQIDSGKVEVDSGCFEVKMVKKKDTGRKFVPQVIEPSYGIDRILYAVLEHSYLEKEEYVTLKLKPDIAPIKVGIFPLMSKDELNEKAKPLDNLLRNDGIFTYYDDSGSIGRRYARMDEVGTPFCITVDYDTLKDNAITIRDRDTADQVRVKIDDLRGILGELLSGTKKFDEIKTF
jgi:glycyl-tRNA synthetase